jgi:hypothetical protein
MRLWKRAINKLRSYEKNMNNMLDPFADYNSSKDCNNNYRSS